MTEEMKDILEEVKRRILWDNRGKKVSANELKRQVNEEIERLLEKRNIKSKELLFERLKKAGICDRSFVIVDEE